jgi:hypothetical protein
MDPSITSKTTILYDITTILLTVSLLQVVMRIRIYSMIDHFFKTSLIKDDVDDHGGTTISNCVTCGVLL